MWMRVLHSTGETAFSAALTSGRLEMCEYLLACGAHPHAACIVDDGVALSTLAMAVRTGDVEFVKRLVWRGFGLRTRPHGLETCALLEAIKLRSTTMVDALYELTKPIYIDRLASRLKMPPSAAISPHCFVSAEQRTWLVLCIACWFQDLRLIKHLLATRRVLQDPKEMAKNGVYALFLGVFRENEEIVGMFLKRGVPIDQRIDGKRSALGAAVTIDSLRMLRFLLIHRADLSRTYRASRFEKAVSLLAFAVRCGAMQCAHALLPLETRAEKRDEALLEAVKQGDLAFARLLLDVALPSTQEAFIACVEGSTCPVMLDFLLSRCCTGKLPISVVEDKFALACARGISADVVSVFLAHGIEVMYTNTITRIRDTTVREMLEENGKPLAAIKEETLDGDPASLRCCPP